MHPNEMGDVGPALDLLLRTQGEYARQATGVTRGMVDVCKIALVDAIERWHKHALARLVAPAPTKEEYERFTGQNQSNAHTSRNSL